MICKHCKKDKPVTDFRSQTINGIVYIRKQCQTCKQAQQTKRVCQNRDKLSALKLQCMCADCGNKDARVLEFHHRDPKTKEANIANMLGYSFERLQKEIKKCECLCANCHRIRHHRGSQEVA